jgi:hypothetical protein
MALSPVPAAGVAGVRGSSAAGSMTFVLRDIARGGLAGLVTGVLIAGIGGRIVMRVAALQAPTAVGRLTENGNRIGDITAEGSLGLVLLGGLFFGLAGATVWVVVSPWIPGSGPQRAVLAMPVAVALTGVTLIQGRNTDFQVLRHDGMTVVLLLLLLAVAGASISLFDGWLDRRLPRPGASRAADAVYLALTAAGGLLILPAVIGTYLGRETLLGVAVVAVGIATLFRWAHRHEGTSPPARLMAAGRGSLLIAVAVGVLALAPDVMTALGWT